MKKYVILAAVCWFAVISLVGIILTVYDKRIAGSGKRRIPEATLMTVGLLGAAGPMYLTMKKIRHKTKHKKFMLGLPAEVLLHILIIAAAVYFSLSCAAFSASTGSGTTSETVFLISIRS